MIFGFNPAEAYEGATEIKDIVDRVYLEVIVNWLPTGQIIPLVFVWEDGRKYRVGKIINMRKGHSLKAFSPGLRYCCQKGNRRYYLHYDGERWYIETKK